MISHWRCAHLQHQQEAKEKGEHCSGAAHALCACLKKRPLLRERAPFLCTRAQADVVISTKDSAEPDLNAQRSASQSVSQLVDAEKVHLRTKVVRLHIDNLLRPRACKRALAFEVSLRTLRPSAAA